MNSGQRKNSRTRTKSKTGRTKARRSAAKALARTAEHVKRQAIKPRSTRQPHPVAPNGSVGHELNAISTGTSSRSLTASVRKQTDPAPVMLFSPLAMLVRQQKILTTMLLHAMQTQQNWARAFSPWRTA